MSFHQAETRQWRQEFEQDGQPQHECEPIAFRNAAGMIESEYCGVCGVLMTSPFSEAAHA